jgi:hypothetical protein
MIDRLSGLPGLVWNSVSRTYAMDRASLVVAGIIKRLWDGEGFFPFKVLVSYTSTSDNFIIKLKLLYL